MEMAGSRQSVILWRPSAWFYSLPQHHYHADDHVFVIVFEKTILVSAGKKYGLIKTFAATVEPSLIRNFLAAFNRLWAVVSKCRRTSSLRGLLSEGWPSRLQLSRATAGVTERCFSQRRVSVSTSAEVGSATSAGGFGKPEITTLLFRCCKSYATFVTLCETLLSSLCPLSFFTTVTITKSCLHYADTTECMLYGGGDSVLVCARGLRLTWAGKVKIFVMFLLFVQQYSNPFFFR